MGIATTDEQTALQRSIRQWASGIPTMDVVRGGEPRSPVEARPRVEAAGAGAEAAGVEAAGAGVEAAGAGVEAAGTAGARAETEPTEATDTARAGVWAGLAELGVLGIALPEEFGGAGGSILDVAVALEQAAELLVPGPLVPTLLAGLVLARHADPVTAKRLVPRLVEGSVPAGVALGPGDLRARVQPDGGLRVDGRAGAVLGASPGAILVLAARVGAEELWFTVDSGHPRADDGSGLQVEPSEALDFSRPLAEVRCDDLLVPADHRLAGLTAVEVQALAAVLAGAEAAGLADWCLRTACDHARVREQFGRPIGSFQAIKHLCAQMLCRRELAAAVAWDAARAAAEARPDRGVNPDLALTAAVAAATGLDAAVENAKDCIQVLGGIGFTWEHDAHLYLRRALAQRQWLGGGARWRRRVAELALAGGRRRLDLGLDLDPDLDLDLDLNRDPDPAVPPLDHSDRQRIRADLAAVAALPVAEHRPRLAETGYLVPHWPAPYGLDASAGRQLLIDEELRRAGLARPDLVVGGWALPTIIQHGTEQQQERFVLPTLRGDLVWCQLFSEPEAGSDLASLRTRARRVDGGWRLTGQKVWTSAARSADWAICLARTDPDQPKHRGISYFLLDMTAPGIRIRPLREITGDSLFNEVFLDDVLVPDDQVVGPVNGGWRLARTTLAEERVALGGGPALGAGMDRLLRLLRPVGSDGSDGSDGSGGSDGSDGSGGSKNASLQEQWLDGELDRIGALVSEGTAVSLIGLRSTALRLQTEGTGRESSSAAGSAVLKLVGVRHRQAVAEAAYELLGPQAIALDPVSAPIAQELLRTRCLSIAGGTTQIMLTQVAERLLALPREPVG